MKKKIVARTIREDSPEYLEQEPYGFGAETEYFLSEEDGVGVVEIILILVGIHTTPQPIVLC